jgi:hypothetical protein
MPGHNAPPLCGFDGPAANHDGHTEDGDTGADPVVGGERKAVDEAEPEEGGGDVDASVGGVDAAAGGGVEREEIDEEGKGENGGEEEPRAATFAEPVVREEAAEDFGEGGEEEEAGRLEEEHPLQFGLWRGQLLAGVGEDVVEHFAGEAAGGGVLLAGVVRAEEPGRRLRVEDAVAEIEAAEGRNSRVNIEGEAAEDEHAAEVFEEGEFAFEIGLAGADLVRVGLVIGWGATDGGGDPGVVEGEAVAAMGGGGLVGEAGFVEGAEEEVAGTVAGEDAAGAVGAVGAGGEAENKEAGGGVAEARDGAAPVVFRLVSAALHLGDVLAVLAEARAEVAGGDVASEGGERGAGH